LYQWFQAFGDPKTVKLLLTIKNFVKPKGGGPRDLISQVLEITQAPATSSNDPFTSPATEPFLA
jgi:hypothetical protein